MDLAALTLKKQQLDSLRPLPVALVRNLEDWFRVELTYSSNALEGNTLSRKETALVLEKGITVGGKSLVEHLEATNHAAALDWVCAALKQKPVCIGEKDILRIHDLILKGIDDAIAGQYRTVPVRISGSAVVLPNPRKVPELMHDFILWLAQSGDLHPVAQAAEAHYRLVTIHPFVDGNGRTARLLMNMILLMHGYPAAIIRTRDRLAYISALEKAQLGGSIEDYNALILKAVDRSLDMYLKAAMGESVASDEARTLLKIGTLAKATGENSSTLRYWTKQGLLEVVEVTAAGYQLYDAVMIERVKQINALKAQRLTLEEIKQRLL